MLHVKISEQADCVMSVGVCVCVFAVWLYTPAWVSFRRFV